MIIGLDRAYYMNDYDSFGVHSNALVSRDELFTIAYSDKFRSRPVRTGDPIPNCKLHKYVKKVKGMSL